jgi:hypothetical protein
MAFSLTSSTVWAEEPTTPVQQNNTVQLATDKSTDTVGAEASSTALKDQAALAEQVAEETVAEPETEINEEAAEEQTDADKAQTTEAKASTEEVPKETTKTQPKVKRKRIKRSLRGFKKGLKKRKRLRKFPTNRPKRALKEPPALGQIPFPLGETLTFKVNMLNAHSGTVTLKVGRRGKLKEKSVLELSGFVQSSPVLENFYPIRDSLRVFVDERTFQPVKSEFFLNEKGRKVEYVSEFDQDTGRLDWTKVRELKKRKKTSKLSYMAPHPMHETLSSLYALRRLDLKVGMSFEQYIWDGQRERLIEVKVLGEERVLTGIGWVEAYKISIQGAITGGIISKRALKRPPVKGFAWIAKDAYRTPIKAITPTKLGQAEAVLSAKSVNVGE